MEQTKTTTGKLISFYRHKKRMQQKDLAFGLNIAQSKISDWENDKVSPSVDEIMSLAEFFDVDPTSLIPSENNINYNNEFTDNAINNGQNINHYYNNIEEERNANREVIRAKDELLKGKDDVIKLKDELIDELRKKLK